MAEALTCGPPVARPGAQGRGTERLGMTRAELVALGPRPPAALPPLHLRKGPRAPGVAAGSGEPAPARAGSLSRSRSRGRKPGTGRRTDRAPGGPWPPARPPPPHLLVGEEEALAEPADPDPAEEAPLSTSKGLQALLAAARQWNAAQGQEAPAASASSGPPPLLPHRRETEAGPASRRSVTPPRVPVMSGVRRAFIVALPPNAFKP